MVELISEPKVGLAFTYGRKSLPAALREHWWIYCIIALVGALLTAQSATSTSFKTSGVDALAIFPALAVATRLATPEFRLTARIFSRLLGFYFLFVEVVHRPPAVLMAPRSHNIDRFRNALVRFHTGAAQIVQAAQHIVMPKRWKCKTHPGAVDNLAVRQSSEHTPFEQIFVRL